MLEKLKPFYDAGFALHWCVSKSKRPVNAAWTKGPRLSWEDFAGSYKAGLNVGVRLGTASKLEGGRYLGVIDCDVKSTDPKHLIEMQDRLGELGIIKTLTCMSGRGNGSRHLYISSEKPLTPRRISQSSEKVKVSMPSVKATPHELKTLTKKEISQGLRLRPAWEISLMGEGQQVVMPPSIHPDSGKEYYWVNPKDTVCAYDPEDNAESKALDKKDLSDFKAVPVELFMFNIPESMVAQIVEGEGVEDRSAALFGASIALKRAGLSEDEILSVLTEPSYYLGAVAYDHTGSKSRARAAEWVLNFTLRKASDVERDEFEVVTEDDLKKPVDLEKAGAAVQELLDPGDWRNTLERNQQDGKPRNSLKNLLIIFNELAEGEPFIQRDDFAFEDKWLKEMPWGDYTGGALTDGHCRAIKVYLSEHFRMEPDVSRILEALLYCSESNHYHPVKDYLDTLTWDGKPRAEDWLINYLGAHGSPKEYLRAVGLKTLVAMVARVMEPGIKFDHVLILEGNQGAGKSSAARILSDPWFSDCFLNINDKDAVMNMHGVWVNELGELNAMSKGEVNAIKDFVTRQSDKIRPPYGKLSMKFPRQNIFIGTTNNKDYLKDSTGNRRFWPVAIRDLDREGLTRDRDQLLAEAVSWYIVGEKLYLNAEQSRLATHEQGLRLEFDELESELSTFLDSEDCPLRDGFTFYELIEKGPKALEGTRTDRAAQMRIARILKNLDFENSLKWEKGVKKQVRKWCRKLTNNVVV